MLVLVNFPLYTYNTDSMVDPQSAIDLQLELPLGPYLLLEDLLSSHCLIVAGVSSVVPGGRLRLLRRLEGFQPGPQYLSEGWKKLLQYNFLELL